MTDEMLKKQITRVDIIKNSLNPEEAKKLIIKYDFNMSNFALVLKNFE